MIRLVLTRVALSHSAYKLRDAAMTSILVPQGLTAALLAGLPLQYGVIGMEVIRDTTYMVVLASISLTALLVALYPIPSVQWLYSKILHKALPPK